MENPYAAPTQLEYDPGVVRWWQFLCAAAVAFSAAGALALLLQVLFRNGLYLVIWVPAIAATVLAALLFWSVQVGHCRSRWMAVLIAFAAANVMYWGQYYFDMVERGGRAVAWQLDRLPAHIAWRKGIEIHRGSNSARFGARKALEPTPGLNWFNSGIELSLVLLLTISAAVASASRPYCSHCREWMRRDAALLPEGAWQPLLDAVETDSLDDLLGLPEISPFRHRRFTAVTVAWCPPRRGRAAKCPAYLSIKDVRYGGGLGQLNQIDLSFGRTRLRMHPLTKRQIAALRLRFLSMAHSAVGCDRPAAGSVAELKCKSGMAIYSTFFLCDPDKLLELFPGWRPPLAEPVVREVKNPFTGELTRVSSREPNWPDEAVEGFPSPGYQVVAIQGDYRDYLEGRLPLGVHALPHWATKGLTEAELMPLAEAAGTESALDVALYAPPSFAATLDEVNADLVLALGAADDQTLQSIAARWAATMSSPDYTHSVTGEKLDDGWSTSDALELLRPLVALIGRSSAEQRLYLLVEA